MAQAPRALVVDISQLQDLPFQAIRPAMKRLLLPAGWRQRRGPALLRLLECFLQVTGLRFRPGIQSGPHFEEIAGLFIGALHSTKFFEASFDTRYFYARYFLSEFGTSYSNPPRLSSVKTTDEVLHLQNRFEQLPLDDYQCWLCSGFRITNSDNKHYWLQLRPAVSKMGRAFIKRLHEIVSEYWSVRRAHYLPGIKEFVEYLDICPGTSAQAMLTPAFMQRFWHGFWDYYYEARKNLDSNETLLNNYTNQWCAFVFLGLIPSGLVAPLLDMGMPGPNTTPKQSALGVSDTTDDEGFGKLLVVIPDSATDSEAWRLLLQTIPLALKRIEQWANTEANSLYARYKNRIELSSIGHARPPGLSKSDRFGWILHRNGPNSIANAAATYEQHGHPEGWVKKLVLRCSDKNVPYELGIPIAGSLLAHATLISMADASITTSFLNELNLYNLHGHQIGYIEHQGTRYLVGNKRRKGAPAAQLRIVLTSEIATRVEEVIAITEQARKYLRGKGDPAWTRLFLQTGMGLGYPKTVELHKNIWSLKNNGVLVSRLQECCSISIQDAEELASLFTLRNVRVTIAIKKFIDTHSESEAAFCLGHTSVDFKLLERYLPPPLVAFYRERWVRAFQHDVIICAIDNDDIRLKAIGFSSKEELRKYMDTGGYASLKGIFEQSKMLPSIKSYPDNMEEARDSVFTFNANVENIVALMAIHSDIDGHHLSGGEHEFFREFSNHMLNQARARQEYDPRLSEILDSATKIIGDLPKHE
nr:hypothetical protein [uncultured Albidiferax sp.]